MCMLFKRIAFPIKSCVITYFLRTDNLFNRSIHKGLWVCRNDQELSLESNRPIGISCVISFNFCNIHQACIYTYGILLLRV